jgi:hypothetical protein
MDEFEEGGIDQSEVGLNCVWTKKQNLMAFIRKDGAGPWEVQYFMCRHLFHAI